LPSSLNSAPVSIRFFIPDDKLKPYISTFYLTEVSPEKGQRLGDWLHPEWANLRFTSGEMPIAALGDAEPQAVPRFSVIGPTSKATWFESGAMRSWGIGLLPSGWSRFIGMSAELYADRPLDGSTDPATAPMAALHDIIFDGKSMGPVREVSRISAFLTEALDRTPPDNPLIAAAHAILIDPELRTVQEMAERLTITGRTLDRLCRKAFGFPPKLLLQRQRFLRSLAENMLNPDQNWVSSLDGQYYDQAHFGRDFQRFMGMSATEYKALPHPFLNAAVHGRMAAAGAAMQVLHDPAAESDGST
jgi:AraC-like DNA-binding protein